MVAKLKTSFLKNSFQLFCHKHFTPKDVVHNSNTINKNAPLNAAAALNDEFSKKLSTSSPSLNNQRCDLPESSNNNNNNIRLSKKDKNILKIIHSNSAAVNDSRNAASGTAANRSASLNYKTVFSINNINNSNNAEPLNYGSRTHSPSPHRSNSYLTTSTKQSPNNSPKQECTQQQPTTSSTSIQIKQSKSHPNFSINTETSNQSSPELKSLANKSVELNNNSVKTSPVQLLGRSTSREALITEEPTSRSSILPVHYHHHQNNSSTSQEAYSVVTTRVGKTTSPSNSDPGVLVISDGEKNISYKAIDRSTGELGSGSSAVQLVNDDQLPDVIYVAYKKRSVSTNPSSNSPNSASPPTTSGMENENFKLRLLKSNTNKHASSGGGGELNANNNEDLIRSSGGSSSQQQATLLPNGAILIEPPSINRNVNRYSMPIMQSPLVPNANNTNQQQQQLQILQQNHQQQQQPVIMNENNLNRNPSLVNKVANSDFIQFDKNANGINHYPQSTLYHNQSIAHLKQLKLARKLNQSQAAVQSPTLVFHSQQQQQQQPPQNGKNYIPFSVYEPVVQTPQQQVRSSHISRHHMIDSAPPLKRSLKSSLFTNKSSAKLLEKQATQQTAKPRSMSVNSKKVVRFADSLGLELESFIPFSHGHSSQYAKTHHYQFYQQNPVEFVNPHSSQHRLVKSSDVAPQQQTSSPNIQNIQAHVNSRNNYLNKVHSMMLIGNNSNNMNSSNNGSSKNVPTASLNSKTTNPGPANGHVSGVNFYEEVMNQLTLNSANKGTTNTNNINSNESNNLERQYESILEQQFMQQQQKLANHQKVFIAHQQQQQHQGGNKIDSVDMPEPILVSQQQQQPPPYKISSHMAKTISNSSGNLNGGNQNVTITTRINNGKLESEV